MFITAFQSVLLRVVYAGVQDKSIFGRKIREAIDRVGITAVDLRDGFNIGCSRGEVEEGNLILLQVRSRFSQDVGWDPFVVP